MVGAIIAFLLSASVGAEPPLADSERFRDIFVSACLDGRATLAPGEAQAVGFGGLPARLRKELGAPASADVWRLGSGDRAYLYVLNYQPNGTNDTKICGLASEDMNLTATADAVQRRIAGSSSSEERAKGMQWLVPKENYVATVGTVGDFNLVQINWLSDRGRSALLGRLRSVVP